MGQGHPKVWVRGEKKWEWGMGKLWGHLCLGWGHRRAEKACPLPSPPPLSTSEQERSCETCSSTLLAQGTTQRSRRCTPIPCPGALQKCRAGIGSKGLSSLLLSTGKHRAVPHYNKHKSLLLNAHSPVWLADTGQGCSLPGEQ